MSLGLRWVIGCPMFAVASQFGVILCILLVDTY